MFAAAWAPAAVLVFLLASDFFSAWGGYVVSVRPSPEPDPASYRVLISDGEGTNLEKWWPADQVRPYQLPVDGLGLPPADIPTTRPRTNKTRFQLHYLVHPGGEDADWQVIPTTSPTSLGLALFVWVLGIAIRNMAWSGSPFSLEPRGVFLPRGQAAAGAPAQPSGGGRPRKGPPPPKRRRGRGR